MKRLRSKLTYANVVSTLCLCLLVGGGSAFAATQMLPKNSVGSKQLKKNAVTAAKIKNGSITGAKLSLSTLGTVPSAASAATADTANTAANANALGGRAPSGYAITQLEAEHVVGKPGQPAFESGCHNFSPGDVTEVGFYKDPFGVVHLRGYVAGCTGSIFTLPAGFRPKEREFFAGATGNTTAGLVTVDRQGVVEGFGGSEHGLSNIEFRTDS